MRILLTVAAGLLLLGSPAAADRVDDYVRSQLKPRHIPGLSLAVVQDGRIVKAAGYGLASLELDAPASPRTVYELGSIGKQFAADAILLLVEDGKLQLDDLLSKYVDRTPPAWSAITLRHILTHTAGLADFDTGSIGFSYRREYTGEEFVDLLGKQPLQFAPGERWNYTNAFPLLGLVVERVSGMPYMTFVKTRIFTPLGLTSARFKTAGEVVPMRADAYLFADGVFTHGETLRPAIIAPNGGVMMNVLDFAAWDIAITQGRLLRPESLKAMTTPVRLQDGRTVSHGLGWFMDQFNGHPFGAHWGSTVTGHTAVIKRYVNEHVTVIVLANLGDDAFGVDAISKRVADMYVPGAALQGLKPGPDPDPAAWGRLRARLESVAAGVEDAGAPGLAKRLPPPVRERLAVSLRTATSFQYLGEEQVGASHFTLDPLLATNRWYRAVAPAGMRYLTLRLSATGTLLGVLVEDD
jgi:CubicO group peptidase (beta-lactamase class C family)